MPYRGFLVLTILLLLSGSNLSAQSAAIQLDGVFSDWNRLNPIYEDPAGDSGHTGIDFTKIWIANDDDFLFIRFKVGIEMNLQEGDRFLKLFLDTDDNPATGWRVQNIGAELSWHFNLRRGYFDWNEESQRIYFNHVDLRGGPSVSGSDFEIAISRHALPDGHNRLFPGNSLKIVLQDDTWISDEERVSDGDILPDEGHLLSYTFDEAAVAAPGVISFAPNGDPFIRVYSQNMSRDSLFEPSSENSFRRIIQAVQPDIITFQEVYNHSAGEVLAKIRNWLGGPVEEWYAHKSGDDLVIVSRYPIEIELGQYFENLHERFQAVLLRLSPQQNIIIFNAHLNCCENDAARQMQADSFIASVRQLHEDGLDGRIASDTPFLLTGDLNLVGDPQQLDTLLNGTIINQSIHGPSNPPDWDGTGVTDLICRQTERRMAYTWRNDDNGQNYWPGRMDFIIYSDSVMTVDKHFVIYTGNMSSEELTRYGLQADDTNNASDHLPMIADIFIHGAVSGWGDVDGDGILSVTDALLMHMMQNFVGEFNPYHRWMADLDGNSVVDELDRSILLSNLSENK